MEWEVLESHGDTFRIRGRFDQLRYTMTGNLGEINYDSKSTEPKQGRTAAFETQCDELAKSNFEFTLSDRGNVKEVRLLPGPVAKADFKSATDSDATLAADIESILSRCLLSLPVNRLVKGDVWSTSGEMGGEGALGKQTAKTTYRYEGVKKIKGAEVAILKSTCDIGWEPTPHLQINFKQQSSEGEVLFDLNSGRLQLG